MSARHEEIRALKDAVAYGVAGDPDAGVALLQPLVDAGRLSTFALLCSLAEVAAFTALQNRRPGEAFAMSVESTATGRAASAEAMPVSLRFVGQFVTSWANRDQDTAFALFKSLADEADRTGSTDLGDAIGLVYGMAVATAAEAARAHRERGCR